MKKKPPVKVSQETVTFNVEELEPLLSPPNMDLKPFKPMCVTLKNKKTMLIREAKREEAIQIMNWIRENMLTQERDFYDIVGARVFAELLGWYRNRLKDPYLLIGVVDGEIVGLANGRLMNEDVNISLHTMAFKRGLRAGACLYYAKAAYCFDILGQEEFWATYESYNGLKRWGIGMAQPSYPWPDVQHELGGAKVFYVTKKYWNTYIKDYVKQMVGSTIKTKVPAALLKKNAKAKMPKKVEI